MHKVNLFLLMFSPWVAQQQPRRCQKIAWTCTHLSEAIQNWEAYVYLYIIYKQKININIYMYDG